MGLVRLVIFGFIFLTVIYVLVSIYSRSVRREKLEKRWATDHPGDNDSLEREAYIETGMHEYQTGFRRKLIVLVYIIPAIAAAALFILIN